MFSETPSRAYSVSSLLCNQECTGTTTYSLPETTAVPSLDQSVRSTLSSPSSNGPAAPPAQPIYQGKRLCRTQLVTTLQEH